MTGPRPPEPQLVTVSNTLYHLLLAFYPARFRLDYGDQMAQVFRDCCRSTYHQSGAVGILGLWPLTILDWMKTVIEEGLYQEIDMRRARIIQLSGWGLMAGPFVLFIGLGEPEQYSNLIADLFSAPGDPSRANNLQFITENVLFFLVVAGCGLILFGFWGLSTHYSRKVRGFGRLGLRLLVISSAITVAGAILSWTRNELWWSVFIAGFLSTFIALIIFGVDAIRERPLPRWNALPFLTGVWLPGMLVIGGLFGLDDIPTFTIVTFLIAFLGITLNGYVLQSGARAALMEE